MVEDSDGDDGRGGKGILVDVLGINEGEWSGRVSREAP